MLLYPEEVIAKTLHKIIGDPDIDLTWLARRIMKGLSEYASSLEVEDGVPAILFRQGEEPDWVEVVFDEEVEKGEI